MRRRKEIMAPEIAAALIGAVPSIWSNIIGIRDMMANSEDIINAYRYEVKSNQDLLKELKIEALKDTDIDKPEFRNLVNCLQTQIGASILYDANQKKYKAFMADLKKKNVKMNFEPETEGANGKAPKTLLEAMHFSVDKIEHLKRLVFCASEGKTLFHDFRLNVRIQNIMNSMEAILKAFSSPTAKRVTTKKAADTGK
jgi:hypothetical protein